MSKIAVLSELVQNRIAAGEVVERPCSVVKELVENALDAGSTRVDVEIEQGGRRRIRVADDGCGMEAADLALALSRFATSKLRSEEDLAHVGTLGFRGEALPSMASVAEMEIVTRTHDADEGHRLAVEPGDERPDPEPAACSPGTIVELRDLFSRTPARLKFLKSDTTENSAVAEAVQRLALSRPDVGFRMRADGRELLAVPASQDLASRAAAILGSRAGGDLVEVSGGEAGWLALSGLVLAPGSQGRRDRRWQFFFVNGRPVKDRVILHAVEAAYETLMPHGRRPVYVLMMDIDPAQVDVNVHPAKTEVRFRSSRSVHEFVRRTVRDALRSTGADVGGSPGYESGVGPRPERDARDVAPPPRSIQRDLWGSGTGASAHEPESVAREAPPVYEVPRAVRAPAAVPVVHDAGREETDEVSPADVRIVGALSDGYVVVETPHDVRLVDPHAVHERLIYEQLSQAADDRPAESQSLLVPETVDLTPAEAAGLDRAQEALTQLGFVAEAFGGSTVAIRAVPASIPVADAAEVLREVLGDIQSGGAGAGAKLMDRIRMSIACRAAVKLGTALDASEIAWLLTQSRDAPGTCPHGRPFAWVIPRAEIVRRLGR